MLLATMVIHLRLTTFADAFANPAANDEDELIDTLTDAILRLAYGVTPTKR